MTDLVYSTRDVIQTLGYADTAPDYVQEALDSLIRQVPDHVAPECGYLRLPATIERDRFQCGSRLFACGPLIGRHLQDATEVALFAATLGPAFDTWSHGFFERDDPFLGYLSSTLGSVLAEAVVDWLEGRLQEDLDRQGLKRSNRVSPGYCQWSVSDQQGLFGLLPEGFCGIRLNDSSLMSPIKSVSGVIGIGSDVRRRDYACARCDQQQCIMRRQRPSS